MTEKHEPVISWEALMRIVLMIVGIFLLWKALGAVFEVIGAVVLAASLYPLVQGLHIKAKIPFIFSIILVFLILFTPFIVLGFALVPTFNTQFPELIKNITATINQIPLLTSVFGTFDITQYIQGHTADLIYSSQNIIWGIVAVFTIIILSFYFLYDYERLFSLFINIFPYREKERLKGLLEEVMRVLGLYIRGNIIISFITFAVVYIGLLLLNIPFALPLALFAAVTDLLPLVGSTVGAIPALLVAFSLTPVQGFSVLLLHLVYQQVENGIISPLIYNKALNLYPALGFLAVVIGASLFGMLGAFLALPVAAIIPTIVEYGKNYTRRHEAKA